MGYNHECLSHITPQIKEGEGGKGGVHASWLVPHNGEAYTSGTVDVTGVGVVSNYKLLKGKPETLTDWDTDPV